MIYYFYRMPEQRHEYIQPSPTRAAKPASKYGELMWVATSSRHRHLLSINKTKCILINAIYRVVVKVGQFNLLIIVTLFQNVCVSLFVIYLKWYWIFVFVVFLKHVNDYSFPCWIPYKLSYIKFIHWIIYHLNNI